MTFSPPPQQSAQSLWRLMPVTCHSSSTAEECMIIRKLIHSEKVKLGLPLVIYLIICIKMWTSSMKNVMLVLNLEIKNIGHRGRLRVKHHRSCLSRLSYKIRHVLGMCALIRKELCSFTTSLTCFENCFSVYDRLRSYLQCYKFDQFMNIDSLYAQYRIRTGPVHRPIVVIHRDVFLE